MPTKAGTGDSSSGLGVGCKNGANPEFIRRLRVGVMEQSGSLVFDRAVEYYDETRALSDKTMAHIVRIVSAELGDRGPCVEIGIGTGRIALPLAEAGVELIGADLSRPMLARLLEKAARARVRVPVVEADATALPFPQGRFGGALAVHVLHLIPQWREAARELVRVVRPRGVALVDLGGWGSGPGEEIHSYFCAQAGIAARHRGANEPAELDEFMSSMGMGVRELDPITESHETTHEDTIARLESGIFSFTWDTSEENRRQAGEATRAWARDRFGPLDQTYSYDTTVAYRAYDAP